MPEKQYSVGRSKLENSFTSLIFSKPNEESDFFFFASKSQCQDVGLKIIHLFFTNNIIIETNKQTKEVHCYKSIFLLQYL